jgi:hypothetical protein
LLTGNTILKSPTLKPVSGNGLHTWLQDLISREALEQIASTTLENLKAFSQNEALANEVTIE